LNLAEILKNNWVATMSARGSSLWVATGGSGSPTREAVPCVAGSQW